MVGQCRRVGALKHGAYISVFPEPGPHGARPVALDPQCCGEDEHSTAVLSGALLGISERGMVRHEPFCW